MLADDLAAEGEVPTTVSGRKQTSRLSRYAGSDRAVADPEQKFRGPPQGRRSIKN